jgi:hypothetical protein
MLLSPLRALDSIACRCPGCRFMHFQTICTDSLQHTTRLAQRKILHQRSQRMTKIGLSNSARVCGSLGFSPRAHTFSQKHILPRAGKIFLPSQSVTSRRNSSTFLFVCSVFCSVSPLFEVIFGFQSTIPSFHLAINLYIHTCKFTLAMYIVQWHI